MTTKILKNETAAAATDAQEAARIAAQAAITKAITDQVKAITSAATARDDAFSAYEGKVKEASGARELAMLALSKAATKGDWSEDQIKLGLDSAIVAAFGNRHTETAANTLRSELRQAMNPACRAQVPHIIATAAAAWDAETKAIEADKSAATPLRDEYKRRHHMIVKHVRLAIPETKTVGRGDAKRTETTPAITFKSAADVVKHVAKAAAAKPVKSASDIAAEKVDAIIASVKALADEYKSTETFAPIVSALAKVKAAELVKEPAARVSVQENAITVAPPAASEPIDAAAELDDVLALATQAAITAVKAAMAAK